MCVVHLVRSFLSPSAHTLSAARTRRFTLATAAASRYSLLNLFFGRKSILKANSRRRLSFPYFLNRLTEFRGCLLLSGFALGVKLTYPNMAWYIVCLTNWIVMYFICCMSQHFVRELDIAFNLRPRQRISAFDSWPSKFDVFLLHADRFVMNTRL